MPTAAIDTRPELMHVANRTWGYPARMPTLDLDPIIEHHRQRLQRRPSSGGPIIIELRDPDSGVTYDRVQWTDARGVMVQEVLSDTVNIAHLVHLTAK